MLGHVSGTSEEHRNTKNKLRVIDPIPSHGLTAHPPPQPPLKNNNKRVKTGFRSFWPLSYAVKKKTAGAERSFNEPMNNLMTS